jgi:hypothetical protein
MERGARALVDRITVAGREAGTADAIAARLEVTAFLRSLGFQVEEHAFHFNAGIYRALPVAGGMLALLSLAEVPLLQHHASYWALAAVLTTMLAIAAATKHLLRGEGGPGHRRADANLIASRPGGTVRCWLVAHIDTKAQAQSMAGRLVAFWTTVVAVTALVAASTLRLSGALPPGPALAVGATGILAGALIARGRLTGSSPGARDNGSGLLAVLTAAELASDPSIGIIITGAEEFALAGARALARERPGHFTQASIVNVDTVDDQGTLFVVRHGRAGAVLAGRLLRRLDGLAPASRERGLPIGILVDGVPLAGVALQAVTVGRLAWGTLRAMHTPRDTAAGCLFTTAERLGERLAAPI